MQNFDPKEHVGLLVKFINGRVVNKINKNLSKFNLTRVQHEILCFIDKNEHEGDVFQKDIHVYESVVNKADKIFIGIVNKGDEAEWCVATTDQEVLQPVVEEVFERNDNLEFKKYKQPQSAVLN